MAAVVPSAEVLARRLVAVVAPAELPSFAVVAGPYLAQPRRAERRWRREHDDAMGFGAGEAVALATPVVALVSGSVVTALSEGLAESARAGAGRLLRRLAARFRRKPRQPDQPATPALEWTTGQLAEVRRVALSRAVGLGLKRDKATALADAVVGELVRLHDEQR